MKKEVILTVDLEYDWGSRTTENIRTFVPKILDFFDKHDITATFFVVGDIVEEHKALIREISRKHEIGSHSFSHLILRKLDRKSVEREVALSVKALKKIGIKPYGFRSPEFLFPKYLGSILKKHGFVYDSSVSCSFFPGRYNNLFHSDNPYMASGTDIRNRGKSVLEIPSPGFSMFKMPSGLPFFRLFYPLSLWLLKSTKMIYFHPCEFLEKSVGSGDSFLVRKLYGVNRGEKAWKIFQEVVNKLDANFISCLDIIKTKHPGLL